MTRFKIITLALLMSIGAVWAQRERPTIESRITPESVMIGDPFVLEIDIKKDINQDIAFPEFDFEQQGQIEAVEPATIDTISVEGRRQHLRRRYRLRSFDEGVYHLGRMSVLYSDKNVVDTLRDDRELQLEVLTFQIDSTSHAIYDIKPQRNMPFKMAEISGYLMWGFTILILLVVLIYVVLRIAAHYGKNIGGLFKSAPPVPPHITAIEALEQLHNKKLWQSNKHKQYYSMLTDILRTYISGRYSLAAMEMTTDEIIEAIRRLDMPQKCAMDLQNLLRDADLVKFAKATFEASQNEEYYNKSYFFVEETKVIAEDSEEENRE